MRCDSTYLFDELTCFLSLLFKISQSIYVDLVEDGRCVRTCFVKFPLFAQVGLAINLTLEAMNEGLVAVRGLLKDR